MSASAAPGSGDNEKQPVRDVPKPSVLSILGALWDTNPNALNVAALGGCPFARSSTQVYVADAPSIKQWMPQEWQLGTVTAWPKSISRLLGDEAMANLRDAEKHTALRKIFGVMLTDSEVERMLPGIQATVEKYMADWAAKGTVTGYTEVLTLVFDVLINQAMQLGWSDADIKKYAEIFEVWNQGFTVIPNPLPWSALSRGMRARKQLINRLRESLRDSEGLEKGSMPSKLVEAYGADSDVCTDNLIMVVFAGFETTCGLVTGLLWHLARNPTALDKLRAEQCEAGGGALTLASMQAMKYTQGALTEVLRLQQMVASSPRETTTDLDLPRGPLVPKGTKITVSWGALSLADPAVKGEEAVFRPDRWLDPANAATKADYQKPFGYGPHDCVGRRVAYSISTAVAQELALKYNLAADAQEGFDNFPTGGRPRNGLPLTLTKL